MGHPKKGLRCNITEKCDGRGIFPLGEWNHGKRIRGFQDSIPQKQALSGGKVSIGHRFDSVEGLVKQKRESYG